MRRRQRRFRQATGRVTMGSAPTKRPAAPIPHRVARCSSASSGRSSSCARQPPTLGRPSVRSTACPDPMASTARSARAMQERRVTPGPWRRCSAARRVRLAAAEGTGASVRFASGAWGLVTALRRVPQPRRRTLAVAKSTVRRGNESNTLRCAHGILPALAVSTAHVS